jgi:ABC-type nitrate/sulfonate/bicarbonate transport system substrate-binding protein
MSVTEIAYLKCHRFLRALRPGARAARMMAWVVVAVMGLIALDACKQRRPLREVTLGLSWVHQAQFCGPYYADRRGLYAREGQRVTFVPASATRDPMNEFLDGKYDFVIAQPDALIIARQRGHRVVAVAATYRIHPLVYLSLENSGIEKPQDFRGKTVGVAYSERLPLVAMLRKLDVDPVEVEIVQRSYGFEALQKGEYDVEAGWRTNELIHARRAGLAPNVIAPYDYGITFYADVLVVRESLIEQEPELVARFVRATMRGWTHALQNPRESADLALYYNPHLDPAHEHELLRASAPLIHTGMDQVGWMRAQDWDTMIGTLHEERLIPERPRAADLYTTRFLGPVESP